MKIKTKFLMALVSLLLIPIAFSINITSNIFSDHLRFIPYLDDYSDVFNNFAASSQSFDAIIAAHIETPGYFLSEAFQEDMTQSFQSPFLIVEVLENGKTRFTTYLDDAKEGTLLERWLFNWFQSDDASGAYALKHHQLVTQDGHVIEIRFLIDSLRLELARRVFQRLFFAVYAIANLILLSILIAWMSKPIQKSLSALTHATNAIRKGNYDVKMVYHENDDFEALAQSIEAMRMSLKTAMEKGIQLEVEKKELIANISHDLRTPVTSIRGYAQGLKDGVARTEAMQREYLEIIEAKTYMIEGLVNDLSEISGYDTKGIKLNKQVIDLRRFLFDCVDELEKDVKKYGGNLYLHYIIKDTQIEVDPEKLMRVFINIIENAIKYRSERPIEIVILANRDDDGVFINISDNGIGVPEADLPLIFDRFYRSDKSRNLDIGGSGIGLSICKEIIASHGGKLSAYSNDSDGLTLSIRLPDYNESEKPS